MIVCVYDSKAAKFTTLGLGTITPSQCEITEELNGRYELELIHPYDDRGKYDLLQKDRIIGVDTPRGRQHFRIYKITGTLDEIKVNARHIFYDLLGNFIEDVNYFGPANNCLQEIKNNFNYQTNFTLETNIQNSGRIIIEKENPVTALLGNDEEKPKFIQAFSGELLRDNHNVKILTNIGQDRGYTIRYGKNLLGLDVEEDTSNIVTRLLAISDSGFQTYQDSPKINDYPFIKVGYENFDASDIKELREKAKIFLRENDIPKVTINIDFILLSRTQDYNNYKVLEEVFLGDIVTIFNEKISFNQKAKVIGYTYDVLTQSYIHITLGSFKQILTTSINKADNTARQVNTINYKVDQANYTANEVADKLQGATQIINGILYILDTDNVSTAKTIYKFTNTGISKSTTGIGGEFTNILN